MVDTNLDLSAFVEKASAGILNQYENDFKRQQMRLEEFLTKQAQLLNTVNKELVKFKDLENMQLEHMMGVLKMCQIRLQEIKERIRKASSTAAKLKVRSSRIQEIKQKEALNRELLREAQLTREQEMVAKYPSPQIHDPQTVIKTLPSKPLSS